MTTLGAALEDLSPLLHAALQKAARPTIPFDIRPQPHALATIPGSLAPYLGVSGAPALPYANALAAVLSDVFPAGPNRRPVWPPSTPSSEEDVSGDTTSQTRDATAGLLPFNAPLWTSKLGGFGYLPKDVAYPVHATNKTPLQLLLQLNFSELRAQCVALAGDSADTASAAEAFLPSPPWPQRGILAVYIDCFDSTMGCNFVARDPQNGFRFLFFEDDYEQRILPHITAHLAGGAAADVTPLEAALQAEMWSREEQFAVFADALAADPSLIERCSLDLFTIEGEDSDSDAQLDRDRATLCRYGWLLAHGTVTPTDHAKSGAGVMPHPKDLSELNISVSHKRNPTLWYGDMVSQEHVVTINAARVARERRELTALLAKYPDVFAGATRPATPLMVPRESVEFNQLVLYRALRGPHGKKLMQDILECTAADEVNVQGVSYKDFRKKRLVAARQAKIRARVEGETNATTATTHEESDGSDDESYAAALCFTNQIGGYPSFTQEDPRYMAYSLHDGGFKQEPSEAAGGQASQTGMLIYPEKHSHKAARATADTVSEEGSTIQRDPEDGAIIADYCLFQIGEASDVVMIGDVGIANAFIAEKDLRERRFDRAWFTYDCC